MPQENGSVPVSKLLLKTTLSICINSKIHRLGSTLVHQACFMAWYMAGPVPGFQSCPADPSDLLTLNTDRIHTPLIPLVRLSHSAALIKHTHRKSPYAICLEM